MLNLLSPCRRQFGPGSSRTYAFLKENAAPALRGLPSLQCDSDSSSDTSSASSPSTPTETQFPQQEWPEQTPAAPHTVVYIDLLPEALEGEAVHEPSASSPSPVQQVSEEGASVVHASPQPRCLRAIDPTVTFLAQSTISAQSYFVVYLDQLSVFSEATPLVAVGPSPEDPSGSTLLYSTTLIPGYWKTISESPGGFIIISLSRASS